jgi:hypothetical protein
MVKFQLNNETYSTPSGWDKVTFAKFLEYLSGVATKTPEQLKELYNREGDKIEYWNNMPSKDKGIIFDFFAESVGFWCELDAEEIKASMNLEQLEQAFWSIEIDLNINDVKEDESFTGFVAGGKEYLLPMKNMVGSTVAEFAEAAQFEEVVSDLENGQWLAMQDILVVLCRPKGEVYSYNEKIHNLRKKLFSKITMDKVIQVCFFLHRLNKELNHNLLIYSLMAEVEQRQQKQLEKLTDGL